MRKYLLLLLLLTLAANVTSDINARGIYIKGKKFKNDGPVKNIPPPVIRTIEEFLTVRGISQYKIVQVTRDKNTFRIFLTAEAICADDPINAPMFFIITANGNLLYVSIPQCIKIPPDAD